MILLAIDTSCDETSVAVTQGTAILSNVISTQIRYHKKFGGVVPMHAARLHQERIQAVVEEALRRAGIPESQLNGIAVTYGPGLAPALQVGIGFAKAMAERLSLPLYAVNHMAGHIASTLAVTGSRKSVPLTFPAMALLVSGGHTEIVTIRSWNDFQIIGQTLDDAVGEAFDKVAKMLGLGYPGGKALSKLAEKGDPTRYNMTVPMRGSKGCNLSYSGLKTASRLIITSVETHGLGPRQAADIASTFQHTAFTHLTDKLGLALRMHPEIPTLLVAGGVAANTELRKRLRRLAHEHGVRVQFPLNLKLCTDNAAMIGVAAHLGILAGQQPCDKETLDRVPYASLEEPVPEQSA